LLAVRTLSKAAKVLGVPLFLWVVVISSVVGVAAVSVTQLSSRQSKISQQSYEASLFTVLVTRTVPRKSAVSVDVQVRNHDAHQHSAIVTVSCYAVNGDLLEEQSQLTGEVNGETAVTLSYSFRIDRSAFSYCDIVVEDLT
jgi:Na+/H+-translocating membrane pyrophosphatase